MKTVEKVQIIDVKKRLSIQNNPYYLISFIEESEQRDESNNPYLHTWNNIYFPNTEVGINPLEFKEKKVIITLNYFPNYRKVGEKEYLEVKTIVTAIELA